MKWPRIINKSYLCTNTELISGAARLNRFTLYISRVQPITLIIECGQLDAAIHRWSHADGSLRRSGVAEHQVTIWLPSYDPKLLRAQPYPVCLVQWKHSEACPVAGLWCPPLCGIRMTVPVKSSDSTELGAHLMYAIRALKYWRSWNQLRLNTDKTRFIWLGTSHFLVKCDTHWANAVLQSPFNWCGEQSGVCFESELLMECQVGRLYQVCYFHRNDYEWYNDDHQQNSCNRHSFMRS